MCTYARVIFSAASLIFLLPSRGWGSDGCFVPVSVAGRDIVSVTDESRQQCIDRASIAQPQPELTVEQIKRGPGGAKAISFDQPVHCEFIPYKMRLKGRGKSRKFWCYLTDSQGHYYNDRYQLAEDAVGVSREGSLLDASGRILRFADGAPQRPDIVKVKYTEGGNRGREVYTEVAVSRFLWALGFPADHMFRAQVFCEGCSEDPFRDIRRAADNHRVNETNFFPNASIERKFVKSIETKEDEGWKWDELYDESSWDSQTRTEFEAYVLALNMVHFHNGISKQNTLGCQNGQWDPATGACSRPVVFLDDLGSTFGGGRSRGEYRKYRTNTVFRKPGSCELRADLAGFGRVTESARQFLARRLAALNEDSVRGIFEAAGFNIETTDATLDVWVQIFMKRIEEVKMAACH